MAERKLTLGPGNARISYGKMKNFMVLDYFENVKDTPSELVPGNGYVVGDYVYIFTEEPMKTNSIPWFIYDEQKGYVFGEKDNTNEENYKMFHVDNIRDISLEHISKNLKEDEDLYNEDELRFMNAATTIFKPPINEDDDCLKKILKKSLNILQINVNKFSSRLEKKYMITNMKTALESSTKTSPKMFSLWNELMELDYIIIAKSQPEAKKKIDGYVVYRSKENEVYQTDEIRQSDID